MIHDLSEYFTSFQGEGLNTGRRALFLRYSKCNTLCPFCDTADRLGKVKHQLTTQQLVQLAIREQHELVVITGGEPLLYQDQILDFLEQTSDEVEVNIETNGSIFPEAPIARSCYFNVSPKVCFPNMYDDGLFIPEQGIMKFPVNPENAADTLAFIEKFDIPDEQIWLMPLAATFEEYMQVAPFVTDLALKHSWNFSTRLQVFHRFK